MEMTGTSAADFSVSEHETEISLLFSWSDFAAFPQDAPLSLLLLVGRCKAEDGMENGVDPLIVLPLSSIRQEGQSLPLPLLEGRPTPGARPCQ